MDLKEIDINTRECVDSVQDRNYLRAPVSGAVNLIVHKAQNQLFGFLFFFLALEKHCGFEKYKMYLRLGSLWGANVCGQCGK